MRRAIAMLVSVAAVAALPAAAGASSKPPTIDEIVELVNPCGDTANCQGPEWPPTSRSSSAKPPIPNPCGPTALCHTELPDLPPIL